MMALTKILVDLPPLVSILLKITVLLGLGWTLHFLLARRNPRWRVLLWRAVVAGVALVPILVLLKYLQISIPAPAEAPVRPPTLVEAELPAIETSNSSPMGFVADSAPESRSISDPPFSIPTWARQNLWTIIGFGWGFITLLITALISVDNVELYSPHLTNSGCISCTIMSAGFIRTFKLWLPYLSISRVRL